MVTMSGTWDRAGAKKREGQEILAGVWVTAAKNTGWLPALPNSFLALWKLLVLAFLETKRHAVLRVSTGTVLLGLKPSQRKDIHSHPRETLTVG